MKFYVIILKAKYLKVLSFFNLLFLYGEQSLSVFLLYFTAVLSWIIIISWKGRYHWGRFCVLLQMGTYIHMYIYSCMLCYLLCYCFILPVSWWSLQRSASAKIPRSLKSLRYAIRMYIILCYSMYVHHWVAATQYFMYNYICPHAPAVELPMPLSFHM